MRVSIRIRATIAALISTCVLLARAETESEYRTWTAASGGYAVEARFVRLNFGRVYLKRKDTGTEINLPLARLSKSDQTIAQQLASASAGLSSTFARGRTHRTGSRAGKGIKLSGAAAVFLAPHIPTDPRYQEDLKLFPRGRRMSISGWSPRRSTILKRMQAAGFTAAGPYELDSARCAKKSPVGPERAIRNYKTYGLRSIAKIRCIDDGGKGNTFQKRIDWLHEHDRARLDSNVTREMDYWKKGVGRRDIIEGWVNPREESGDKDGNYVVAEYLQRKIQEQAGPDTWVQSPEATSYSVSTRNFRQIIMPMSTSCGKQMYVNAHHSAKYGYGGPYCLRKEVQQMATYSRTIPFAAGIDYTYDRLVSCLLFTGRYWKKGQSQIRTNEDTLHQIVVTLIAGAQSIMVWRLSGGNPTANAMIDGYIGAVASLTAHGVPEAVLWGRREPLNKSGLSISGFRGDFEKDRKTGKEWEIAHNGDRSKKRRSYPDTVAPDMTETRVLGNVYARGAAVSWSSYQLGLTRFLLMTHQHDENTNSVTVSGFPTSGTEQIRATIVASSVSHYTEGDIVDISAGTFDVTFGPRQSVVLKIEPRELFSQ